MTSWNQITLRRYVLYLICASEDMTFLLLHNFSVLTYTRHETWMQRTVDWRDITNDHGYVPLVVNTSRSFPRSWLITGFVTRLTRLLVEQVLLTVPEHLSSSPVFSGVRVTRSLVLCILFCRSLFWPLCSSSIYGFWLPPFGIFCLLCCLFFDIRILITPLVSFGHCIVCSSIYGFWLPLWYLQTLLSLWML